MSIYVCTHYTSIRNGFDIQVEPTRIEMTGINACNGAADDAPAPLPPVKIELEELRARRDWSDFALWVVGVDFYENRTFPPFNLYALTATTKNDPHQQALRDRRNYPIHIFVPTADSDFLGCSIVAYAHPDLGVTSNLPTEERAWTGQPLVDRPALQITAPTTIPANGTVKARIGLRDHRNKPLARACEIHLETTGGQLARSRLPLDAGKGSVAVSASGLEPGERFKIKAGFRYYSGVAEHWFEVTA